MIAMKSLLAVAGLALSAEKAPALPTMDEFRDALKSAPAVTAPALVVGEALAAARPTSPACPVPDLDGAKIEERWFSSTRDVKWANGAELGTIESDGEARILKDKQGNVIAKGTAQEVKGGRIITVTGCSGEAIGTIEEADVDWSGSHAWTVKDASGSEIGKTGTVKYWQDEYILSGPNGALAKLSGDDEEINLLGDVDGRLVVILSAYNEAADARERAERRRERMGDRPGRGDR